MTTDTVADRRVHPATIPLRVLKDAPSTLLGLPAGYAFLSKQGVAGVLVVAAIIAGVAIVYQWLAWRRFRYGIGTRELVIEKGIFSRTRRSIPFDRIQDVDIERGPLARLFGLARLRIETGGSGGDEGVLDSVALAEAERLRDALRAARRGAMVAEVGDAEIEQRPVRKLFEMPIPRLLTAGLFNFSMVYIAGIFALLQTFGDWLPFDLWDSDRWSGFGRGFADRISPGAIIAVASIAIILGVVTGVARTIARDYGFRLTLEPEGLRRQRGLFTRSDVLIPSARMQLAMLDSGPLRRWFGFLALSFQTLSAGGASKEAGPQDAAPLARLDEVDRILSATEFRAADPASLRMVSRRRIFRRLLGMGLVPMLAILLFSFVTGAILWLLPLLGVLAAVSTIERRFHRYGLIDGLVFVQRGVFARRQWITPTGRIQSLRLSRSWLQRQFDLATLSIDTAGAPMLGGPKIADMAEAEARAFAALLLRSG